MTAAQISDLGRIEADKTDTSVDPLQWTRNPESIPPLEPDSTTLVNIANNITVVNGEGQTGTTETSINVSDLTNTQKDEKTASLPEDLAANLNTNQESEKKTSDTETQTQTAPAKEANQNTGVASVKGVSSNTVQKPKTEKKTPQKTEKPAVKTSPAQKTVSTLYWVQTASLTSRLNAEAARDTLTSKHMKAEIFTKETATGLTYRVRVGPFKNKTEAEYWLKKIKEIKGFEGSYVTQDRKKS